MKCSAVVVSGRPLVLHVSLHNLPAAAAPVYVPRSLKPLGAFVQVEMRDHSGTLVYKTEPPKFAPKLEASHAESYVGIDPGYSYGVLLQCDTPSLPPGGYRLEVSYSNLGFRGFSGHFIGEQRCRSSIDVILD